MQRNCGKQENERKKEFLPLGATSLAVSHDVDVGGASEDVPERVLSGVPGEVLHDDGRVGGVGAAGRGRAGETTLLSTEGLAGLPLTTVAVGVQ